MRGVLRRDKSQLRRDKVQAAVSASCVFTQPAGTSAGIVFMYLPNIPLHARPSVSARTSLRIDWNFSPFHVETTHFNREVQFSPGVARLLFEVAGECRLIDAVLVDMHRPGNHKQSLREEA